ncbi:MAG: type I-U CRISPR-associated protein Csb2 [Candidatus Dadabacteria bacterium]|nr:type I-U CRISPR-associated protein Csb2 [Candidatus Dadabacteria bacterium]MDE0662722.1 type I-U CRISPR-associated protein Csb2 [Candidatus Dadabacteria bacterium]
MFAFIFRFPANRYHATLWGHHVNEATVAWPPEPWRILRALVASYNRKCRHSKWEEKDLSNLISVLAEKLPSYRLPKISIHAYLCYYVPVKGKNPSLVYDAFLQLPKNEKLVAFWPDLKLNSDMFEFASHLAEGIGYLGRAESWTDCVATSNWQPDEEKDVICPPADGLEYNGGNPVRVIAPRSADDYASERTRLMGEFEKKLYDKAKASGKKTPTEEALKREAERKFGPTLPELLVDALSLETKDYQRYGWSRPPASREVIYAAPYEEKSLIPQGYNSRSRNIKKEKRYTVARYLLAGRPLPRIEDAVKIGELIRLAALSKFGWEEDESTGRRKQKAPSVISGRTLEGKPLRDSSHSHAFWLPEDVNRDGWIDHITVYAPEGFDSDVRVKLDRLTHLWVNERGTHDDSGKSKALEWRLALEGFGNLDDFSDSSAILGTGKHWESLTPFLATGHLKAQGYPKEVKRLLKLRGIVNESLLDHIEVKVLPEIKIGGAPRRTTHFHRFRSRGREKQLDTQGALLRLSFPEPVKGPLCLGYACHFGLGLFALQST